MSDNQIQTTDEMKPEELPVKSNNFSSGRSPATEIPNFAPIDQTISTTDFTPSDMPSEPQNGSQDAFTTSSNEDSSVASTFAEAMGDRKAMEDKQNGAEFAEEL